MQDEGRGAAVTPAEKITKKARVWIHFYAARQEQYGAETLALWTARVMCPHLNIRMEYGYYKCLDCGATNY